ncbi:hypothetical protein ACFOGJ_10315 [Marinibaculum pumilum]|uniref:Uncharacterized protein n=1 Tax=Marinibaculum pumilum TaxID=1766165 RepID=A0ABV7L052_9PROT
MPLRPATALAMAALACVLAGPPTSQSLAATDQPPAASLEIPAALVDDLRKVVQQEVALISLRSQNGRHAGIAQAEIDALDKQWRDETKAATQPLIAQLMGSPLSSYLIDMKARSLGLFVEIFVMDEKGLNVGQSSITSDYWQGDEDKYLKTFAIGPDAVHYGEVEYDDTYKIQKQQVSFPIVDPADGKALGAVTFEINLTELERRS